LVFVKNFALDLAGLEHVFGQRFEDSFVPQWEPECLHPADKPTLPVPDGTQLLG
jgi:hypothetical protein